MMTIRYLHPDTGAVLAPSELAERANAGLPVVIDVNGNKRTVVLNVTQKGG